MLESEPRHCQGISAAAAEVLSSRQIECVVGDLPTLLCAGITTSNYSSRFEVVGATRVVVTSSVVTSTTISSKGSIDWLGILGGLLAANLGVAIGAISKVTMN